MKSPLTGFGRVHAACLGPIDDECFSVQLRSEQTRTMAMLRWTLSLLLASLPAPAWCQTWPVKPIRLIVPFASGGAVDITARIVAQPLSERLKQPIVIENRGGAGGNIGVNAAARSAPDGYTVVMATAGQIAINPHMQRTMPFDPLTDLVAIAPAGKSINVLNVHPSVPVQSIKDLVSLARAQPNKLNFATGGIGASAHIATELFMSMTGIKMVHVPYKGGAPATVALLAGEADLSFSTIGTVIHHIKAKRLRALGVTSLQAFELLPEVPAISAAGVPGYESVAFYGLFAPSSTPPEVVKKLNFEIVDILRNETVRRRLLESGVLPFSSSPEAFAAYVQSEHEKWGKLIRDNRITAE
jgi:tripartite-type tricarboxylate transporter receptor subunit TctC